MKNLYMCHIEPDKNDKRSQEEIYQAIVTRIKSSRKNELSDHEVNAAARNLISFCQKILDYKIKQVKTNKKNPINY